MLSINTLEHITWRSNEDYAAIKEECAKLSEISAAIGYDGPVSVEIFRPEYWEEDPFKVAATAKAATEQALGLGQHAAGGSW